jgi:hypothetical protein
MIVSLIPLLVLIAVVIFAVRYAAGRSGRGMSEGQPVRRFFQYALLLGLLFVVIGGVDGLLTRLLENSDTFIDNRADLARSVTFVVVGIPLFALVALWTRRRFQQDSAEADSFGWAFYVTVASLVSLIVALFALHDVLSWVVRIDPYDGGALSRVIVWGASWGVHWWLSQRVTAAQRLRPHHLIGSLIGLGTAAVGLTGLLGNVIEAVVGMTRVSLTAGAADPILRSALTLAVGALTWTIYWLLTAAKSERDAAWFAYVLLAGVGGGLVALLIFASVVLYEILVWLVGEPSTTTASGHFENVPMAAAAAIVGVLVWWYHRAVLAEVRTTARSEVERIYEYLMAGIGLLAAAGGLTLVLVALLESLTESTTLVVGGSAINALLAAFTLLVVGGPVWGIFWRRIQSAVASDPVVERSSPTRRTYLFVLFGLGGIAAVITLLVAVFFLFEDILEGRLGSGTLRQMRVPLGVLITTGAVSAYHWAVYRGERDSVVAASASVLRVVTLVGQADPSFAREVARRTGARVKVLSRADSQIDTWSVDEIVAGLSAVEAQEALVLADGGVTRVIPLARD